MPGIRYPDGSVHHGETLGPAQFPDLDLDGTDLTFIRIDYQTHLQFGDTQIVVETPFKITVDGAERALDPERRSGLGPLLALYPARLASAAIESDLTLRLLFEGGATVAVPPHPEYEAWHVVGPGSRLIVCPPAGSGMLAVWR